MKKLHCERRAKTAIPGRVKIANFGRTKIANRYLQFEQFLYTGGIASPR